MLAQEFLTKLFDFNNEELSVIGFFPDAQCKDLQAFHKIGASCVKGGAAQCTGKELFAYIAQPEIQDFYPEFYSQIMRMPSVIVKDTKEDTMYIYRSQGDAFEGTGILDFLASVRNGHEIPHYKTETAPDPQSKALVRCGKKLDVAMLSHAHFVGSGEKTRAF
jgi:hypothetical protein